ncbi:MAG: hypothetical protein JEZ12_21635 [Desulfobacterium sp.]|nr:hypothetical protein [Desulfobacterium sp.]
MTSLLGAVDLAVNPLTAHSAAEKLRGYKGTQPDSLQAQLAYAKNLLRAGAQREKKRKSWQSHLIAGAVNALAGIVVAADGGRGGDGLVTFASGMLVAEFQIFTMPTRSIDALKAYDNRFNGKSVSGRTPHGKGMLDNLYVSAGPTSICFTYPF